jgi:hypothetical protein
MGCDTSEGAHTEPAVDPRNTWKKWFWRARIWAYHGLIWRIYWCNTLFIPRISLCKVSSGPRYRSPARDRCWTLVFTLRFKSSKPFQSNWYCFVADENLHIQGVNKSPWGNLPKRSIWHTCIVSWSITPDKEPQMNGTTDAGTGSHNGVGPCSPDLCLPRRCRMPSYSRKYNAVPTVSRTKDERKELEKSKGINKKRTTEVEPKSSVQPCNTISPIYLLYGMQCAGRLHQGNAFGCSNGILQLSTNLRIFFICLMNLKSRRCLTFTSSNAGKTVRNKILGRKQDTYEHFQTI